MSQLPIGWANTSLSELIELKYGKALPDRERSGDGFPVFGSNGIVGYHNTALTVGATVVIGRKGSVGEVNFSETSCSPIDTTYYVDSFPGGQSKFWYYKLRSLPLKELNKSTAIPGVSRSDVYPLEITLPPLPEQKRIADKLDSVLARVDACRDHLDRLPALLKRFRQSILAAATSGRLTGDWRQSTNDESKLPARWRSATINEITIELRYGTSKKCCYQELGRPVLRIPNMGEHGRLNLNDIKYAEFDTEEIRKLSLQAGDILIIRSNGSVDLVGKSCVVEKNAVGQLFAGYLMRLRVETSLALPRYVYLCLTTPEQRQKIELISKSTSGVNNINSEEVRSLPLLLPPLPEQTEIVRRVELLFAFADRLEARLATARQQVGQLTPALLAKAFRGELVPQDPADEPAAELLKRLAAQREAAPKARRGRASKA